MPAPRQYLDDLQKAQTALLDYVREHEGEDASTTLRELRKKFPHRALHTAFLMLLDERKLRHEPGGSLRLVST